MKTLILIRHAKSDWTQPLEDHQRPLLNKGIKNAELAFEYVTDFLPKKYVIWSSSARRALETAKIFAHKMHISTDDIIVKDELYTFDEHHLLTAIQNCSSHIQNLVVFGHNPAITDFVNKFNTKFFENIPTSGIVMLNFDTENWKNLPKGHLQKVVFPKLLKNAL